MPVLMYISFSYLDLKIYLYCITFYFALGSFHENYYPDFLAINSVDTPIQTFSPTRLRATSYLPFVFKNLAQYLTYRMANISLLHI